MDHKFDALAYTVYTAKNKHDRYHYTTNKKRPGMYGAAYPFVRKDDKRVIVEAEYTILEDKTNGNE